MAATRRPTLSSAALQPTRSTRFSGTLECELLERRRFKTQAEVRMAVFAFIEGFDNPRRRHSAVGYLSPLAFERRYAIMAQKRSSPAPRLRPRLQGLWDLRHSHIALNAFPFEKNGFQILGDHFLHKLCKWNRGLPAENIAGF